MSGLFLNTAISTDDNFWYTYQDFFIVDTAFSSCKQKEK